MVITQLAIELQKYLQTAMSVKIASGLVSVEGINFIMNNCSKDCKISFIIGVDMPTPPEAIQKLYELSLLGKIELKLVTEKGYYHPKLYLISHNYKDVAYIGSANCTQAGLEKNIELSYKIDDIDEIKKLQEWYSNLYDASVLISFKWLENYKKRFDNRKLREKEDRKQVSLEKKEATKMSEELLNQYRDIINQLLFYKESKDYNHIEKHRKQVILNLRDTIDYPNFKKIDIDAFFEIYEFGHIIALNKTPIQREIEQFRELLKFLCNENIDISKRIDESINGRYKVSGVAIGVITKILIIHAPDKYFVKNNMIDRAIKSCNIKMPRGLTEGQKYKIILNALSRIKDETKYRDFGILDHYLYLIGEKES
jgi:hypothetical protein